MSAPAPRHDDPGTPRVSLGRVVDALEQAGVHFVRRGDGLDARCPLPDHRDTRPSLSVDWYPPDARKDVGRVVVQCHACGKERTPAVVEALGLTLADLHDDPPRRPDPSSPRARRGPSASPAAAVDKSTPPKNGPTIRSTYLFADAAGTEHFRQDRYDPAGPDAEERTKFFAWRHRGGPRGGWVKGKHCDARRGQAPCASCESGQTPAVIPLWHLPGVLAAVAEGRRVWVVEGMKNATDLAAVLPAGEVVTSAPNGGSKGAQGEKWHPEHTAALAGATVTVVADRDVAGYALAAHAAARLAETGAAVRIVRTPLELAGGDASDHLAAGLALDAFEDVPSAELPEHPAAVHLAPAAPVATPEGDTPPPYDARHELGAADPAADDDGEQLDAEDGEPAPVADLAARRIGRAKGKKRAALSQARQLLDLALERYEPVCSHTGEAFLVPLAGPRIARPLRGGARSFTAELAAEFYDLTGSVPGHYAKTDVLSVLQGMAERGRRVVLHRRVARHGEALVLDLGDDTGRAVVITAAGWEVVDAAPVLFVRTTDTGTLPAPVPAGPEGLAELWRLVHVRPADRPLAEAELVFRYFAEVSHPLLALSGEGGTGKTSAAETLAGLIDPAPVVSRPSDPKDWAVKLGQSYSPVLDNVRALTEWQSDALCMAVTGGVTSFRSLYSDGGIFSLGGQQCVAITSIDLGPQAADLTTRMLPVELLRFADHERMSEEDFKAYRQESRARLLGAVLDRVAAVLATLPRVKGMRLNLPRLSDFARACKALDLVDAEAGREVDRFGAYVAVVGAQAGDIAEEDEVAAAVLAFVAARQEAGEPAWTGTSGELHKLLTRGEFRSRYWPETASAFGKRLSTVVGPLRQAGVEVVRPPRSSARRTLTLRPLATAPAAELAGADPVPPATPAPSSPRADGPAYSRTPAGHGEHATADAGPGAEVADVDAGTPAADAGPAPAEVPCPTCAGPGVFCGHGGLGDVEAPCVLCGVPTLVRSACTAARHGDCRPGGGGPVAPTPGPVDAETVPTPAPRTSEATTPTAASEAAQGNTGRRERPARSAPRRGVHLYGVLDAEALTVITDRHAGPSEPLGDAYPTDLAAGVPALARAYGLEALWLHDSALPRFGIAAGTEEAPEDVAGAEAWRVLDRDTPEELAVAVPAWLDGAWCEATTGRELAAALAAFEAAVGMRFHTAPAATAGALLGMLHNRTGARPLVAPEWLPPREVTYGERPLSWVRPLTDDERAARWVIGLDKRAAYPSVLRDLRLGMGTPEHRPDGEWNPKVPGRHRIDNVHPAPDRDPRLPDPLAGAVSPWRCTETLAYAEEVGARFDVVESYVWPDSARPLASFSERIRHGLDALREARAAGTPGAAVALDVLKETYASVGGMLASHAREKRDTPGKMFRPDWTGTVTAKARANIMRNVDKAIRSGGAYPFAGNVDELFFAVEVDDPAAIGLPLGRSTGQYDVKTPATALADVVDAVDACLSRSRPAPAPLLRRLAELHRDDVAGTSPSAGGA